MTTTKGKKRRAPEGEPTHPPRKDITLSAKSDNIEDRGRAVAKLITGAPFAALRVIRAAEHGKTGLGDDIDVPTLLATLCEQGATVNAGSLSQAEAMLMNQATALQSLFSRLAARAMGWDELEPFEAFMRMALRAQSQCRATLETLAAIKNPPMLFAKQANVTTGPQQINNGIAEPSRTRENEITPNKLLEANDGERMDTPTQGATGSTNPELEAVGAINGTENARRKGQGVA